MGLSIGIVGLPNIGKSTTFNALTKAQNAQVANYPFCTIEPNKATVFVPDKRLNELAKIVNPKHIHYSTLDFVDIAGLVKGASKGEGLGNKFLANIKESEVILHLVRCFEDSNIVHAEGSINPIRDIEIIETELILADIQTLENRIEKLIKQARAYKDKEAKGSLEISKELLNHLNSENMVKTFSKKESGFFKKLNEELRFLTNKEMIYVTNVNEDDLLEDNEFVQKVKEYASLVDSKVIKICAKIEEELVGLDDSEQAEFLNDLGIIESGLDQIIHQGFERLGLMSYFTAGEQEVRAWTIHKNTKAPKAAAAIHNDFEKGFIKAEVISYNDYIKYGGNHPCKDAGKMRLEGKEYIVVDGDVMHFRFNI